MGRRVNGLDARQRETLRKESILDAALTLFAERGYSSVSIEELCRHAHVSTKSFYLSFQDREECYLLLMRRTAQRIKSEFLEFLDTEISEAADSETLLLKALASAFGDDQRYGLVLFGRGSATTPAVERERRINRRWAASFLTEIWSRLLPGVAIQAGVASGVIGGFFNIIADWISDLVELEDADTVELYTSLSNFYDVVKPGK
ncbi:TetR/AcrR family transcriptional regulator [Psychromicrobium sp. YIM B11713]|uniref:TetR/AcrR family transcriptional regulator n=1 Tax=Psychromicrobium sp. YIM B11713 TaxID=3145233 RepID=UPI00374F52A2